MEQYDLTLLFSIRDNNYKVGHEEIRESVQGLPAKITKEEDMGERSLAYPVAKQEYGHYLFWELEMERQHVETLKEKLQSHDKVLKFLIVKK